MLTLLLYWLIIGAISYGVVLFLDNAMDYGHIFGEIRAALVKRCDDIHSFREDPNGGKIPITFRERFKEIRLEPDFHERLQMMDNLYWQAAAIRGWKALLLCKRCMSVYAATFAFAITLDTGLSFAAQGAQFLTILAGAYLVNILDK